MTLIGVVSSLLLSLLYTECHNAAAASAFVPSSLSVAHGRRNHRRSVRPSLNNNNNDINYSRMPNEPVVNSKNRKKQQVTTISEWRDKLMQNPAQFQQTDSKTNKIFNNNKKPAVTSKSRRTRQRVEQPQQTYLYAAQRKILQQQPQQQPANEEKSNGFAKEVVGARQLPQERPAAVVVDEKEETRHSQQQQLVVRVRELAQELGLQPSSALLHCDPCHSDEVQPVLVGQIRVQRVDEDNTNDDDDGSSSATGSYSSQYAYLIEKPAGWSILGSGGNNSNKNKQTTDSSSSESKKIAIPRKVKQRVRVLEEDGSVDFLEYSELDVLALLTPEELEEYNADELGLAENLSTPKSVVPINDGSTIDDSDDNPGIDAENSPTSEEEVVASLDAQTQANEQRIAARATASMDAASTLDTVTTRPSVVAWLKDWKASQGTPIRGGNFWTAIAGASEVDDSGLVLLCPKSQVQNVFVERAEYTAVVGNGGYLAPRPKLKQGQTKNSILTTPELIQTEDVSRLRKGRGDDVVQTVRISIAEKPSFCSQVVEVCQQKYEEGIRGDAAGSPLVRFGPRRLIHCRTLSVSSLVHDENLLRTTETIPDDIAVLSDRRNHLEYNQGSFLGRSGLRNSLSTTAYREINGAADGFPGWTVDRYGEWLLVSHDPKEPRGPLPSIHDGNTVGVYFLESITSRATMGTGTREIRPNLVEGRAAPNLFPVQENGVTYLVSLDRDLSTGLFLDQRPQRAWLSRHCGPDTRVLNCFAHTGAFSVAAAAAGASTVSLDLSQKWLDRLPQHLEANGIPFDERHDCIYGDCFDWLVRLAKRGEQYDIVILDPPSASVGKKKKRWSVKNDMDELVALAAGLVKKGGVLWTTTNSKSIAADKFARLCRKGLDDAGIPNAKLERIQPMPVDFPSIGAQPVKNLVWRIPIS